MKKNISINLFGTLYNIDEDAYTLLENYLQSMQRYFSRQKGGEEVADDIEHRVAELLWQRREAGMTAINIDTVKEIIDTIGNAEQIADDENDNVNGNGNPGEAQDSTFRESFSQFTKEAERFTRDTYDMGYKHVKTHQFYRCANDKILGGVCSGLAVYTNTGDPLWWRLGVLALTLLGIGLPLPIIYIVMWIVTPAALTPEDRLRQQGKEITPENLTQQVKEDSQQMVMPAKDTHRGCLIAIIIAFVIIFVVPIIAFFGTFGRIWFHMFDMIF